LGLIDNGDAVVGGLKTGKVYVGLSAQSFANQTKPFGSRRRGQHLPRKKRAEVLAVTDYRYGDISEPYVTTVDLGAPCDTASLLGGNVRAGASLFFVGTKTVNQVAEQSTRGIAVCFLRSGGLKLHEGVPGSHTTLEPGLEWIQFFVLLMPHEFDVANRAGVIEEKQEVLEELQILLEFPPQGTAQDSMVPFHTNPPDEQKFYYSDAGQDIIKAKEIFVYLIESVDIRYGWARRVSPPSTTRSVPVTNAELSEARNKAASLTSAGIPRRPRG